MVAVQQTHVTKLQGSAKYISSILQRSSQCDFFFVCWCLFANYIKHQGKPVHTHANQYTRQKQEERSSESTSACFVFVVTFKKHCRAHTQRRRKIVVSLWNFRFDKNCYFVVVFDDLDNRILFECFNVHGVDNLHKRNYQLSPTQMKTGYMNALYIYIYMGICIWCMNRS